MHLHALVFAWELQGMVPVSTEGKNHGAASPVYLQIMENCNFQCPRKWANTNMSEASTAGMASSTKWQIFAQTFESPPLDSTHFCRGNLHNCARQTKCCCGQNIFHLARAGSRDPQMSSISRTPTNRVVVLSEGCPS